MQPKKPKALLVQSQNIPRRLRRFKCWLNWRNDFVDGRWTKVPYGTNGFRLRWGNPKNLLTFKEAIAAYRNDPSLDGIGFVFIEGDNITGVDWDACIDDQGNVEQWAQLDLADFEHTYIEKSASDKGFHALGLGTTPHNGSKKWKQPGKEKDPGVEIYSKGRWFAVTGHVIGDSKELVDCQSAINSFHKKYFAQPVPPLGRAAHKHKNGHMVDDSEEAKFQAAIAKIPLKVDADKLIELLTFLDADDRQEWLKTLHAIKHTKLPEEQRYQIAYDWSSKSKKFNPNEWPAVWSGIMPDGRYTIKSIFRKAMDNGYKPPKQYKQTENGNAEYFSDLYKHKLRWFSEGRKWLFYDGTRWKADNGEMALSYARQFARGLYEKAADCKDDELKPKLAKWAITSNSARSIKAMLELSKSDLAITADKLDQDPFKFNVLNGTLDLKTGQLLPHNPNDFITKLAPIVFDPEAKCPRVKQFLNEIFSNRGLTVAFILRWFGYCMSGDVREHRLVIHEGEGRNGKGALFRLLLRIWGDYGWVCDPHILLMKKNIGGTSEDVANLRGIRLVVTSELNKKVTLDEAKTKLLTGGDQLNANKKYEHEINFLPTHKLNFQTNSLPIVSDDEATWSRITRTNYGVKFVDLPEDDPFFTQGKVLKRDAALDEKLNAEASGFLNLLLKGCLDWQKYGLQEPEEIKKATHEYKEATDILSLFIKDCCVLGNNKTVRAKELHDRLKQWCYENDEPEINIRDFLAKLEKRGFRHDSNSRGKFWHGLTLRRDSVIDVQDVFETIDDDYLEGC